jgi:hypothetical protein
MRYLIFSVSLFCIASLSSCLTLFRGTRQVVEFKSDPPNAEVYINGKKECVTPCFAHINRLSMPTQFNYRNQQYYNIKKEGYREEHIYDKPSTDWVAIASCVFYGIGVIDFATGAANNYQNNYFIHLTPLTSPVVSAPKAIQIDSVIKKDTLTSNIATYDFRPTYWERVRGKDIISFYPFGLVSGALVVGWETKMGKTVSMKSILGYGENSRVGYYNLNNVTEVYAEIQPRFHFSDSTIFQGFYAAPFLSFKNLNGATTKETYYYDPSTQTNVYREESTTNKISAASFGFLLGCQKTYYQRLNLDVYVGGGMMRAFGDYDRLGVNGINDYKNGTFIHLGASIGVMIGTGNKQK